jgi:hypothetical protein
MVQSPFRLDRLLSVFPRFREKSAVELIALDDLGANVFAVKYRFRSMLCKPLSHSTRTSLIRVPCCR